mgnify:CR=1 FL=1
MNGVGHNSQNNGIMNFDGSNDYVDTTLVRGDLGSQMTISAWYKYEGSDGRYYTAIIGCSSPLGTSPSYNNFFMGKTAGSPHIGVQDGNYRGNFVTGSNAFDGEYHYMVYSFNNGTGKIYLDGKLMNTASFSQGTSDLKVLIGTELEGSGYYFPGKIAKVKFYTRVLSDDEVLNNFEASRGRFLI